MADLPRYQTTGRVYSDLPQLDFANVREAFKQSQTMSSQLDRLSSFAFAEMGKTTEKEAEKFAVDNPLTIEQVNEATKSGITAADLVAASGGGTVWQNTVRKMQGEQLKNQLEVKTKDDLIKIKAQVDLLQLTDPNEIKAKYEATIIGTGKIIGQLSPEAQLRYEAGMGAIASSFYKESVEKLTKNYKTSQEGLSFENMQHSTTAWKSMINVVTDPIMQNEVLQTLGRQVFNQAIEAGPEFAAKQEQTFYKKAKEIQTSFFINKGTSVEFGINPKTKLYDISYALKKIQSGDFGEHSATYEYSIDDKKKISDDSYGLINTQYLSVKHQRDADEAQSKSIMMQDIVSINKKQITGKAANNIIDNALNSGVITISQHAQFYDDKLKKAPISNNEKIQYELAKRDIVSGRIKSDTDLSKNYPYLNVAYIPDAMGLITDTDKREKEKLLNKFSGAEGDPSRQKPETNNNFVDLGNRFDRLIIEQNKDGTFKYPTAVKAMEAAQQERTQSAEMKTIKIKQKTLYGIIKDTYKFNPDNGGFDAEVAKRSKVDKNYMLSKSYEAFKSRVDEYNQRKRMTGMTNAQIEKEVEVDK
jgi:hypothetical protein